MADVKLENFLHFIIYQQPFESSYAGPLFTGEVTGVLQG